MYIIVNANWLPLIEINQNEFKLEEQIDASNLGEAPHGFSHI